MRCPRTLLLYPFFTYFWIAVVFCYCTVIALYIMSSSEFLCQARPPLARAHASSLPSPSSDTAFVPIAAATIDDISSLLNTVSAFTNSTVSNENFTITNFDFGGKNDPQRPMSLPFPLRTRYQKSH